MAFVATACARRSDGNEGLNQSQKRRNPSASADAVDVRLGAHDGAEMISRDGVGSHAMARESSDSIDLRRVGGRA